MLFEGRNPKYGVCIHVGLLECLVLFWGYFDLDLLHIYYIIGGRNPRSDLVYGYILGCRVSHTV